MSKPVESLMVEMETECKAVAVANAPRGVGGSCERTFAGVEFCVRTGGAGLIWTRDNKRVSRKTAAEQIRELIESLETDTKAATAVPQLEELKEAKTKGAMTNETKVERFVETFGVTAAVATSYLFADGYSYSAACESFRLDQRRRELTADCAWFLMRTMGYVTGMTSAQIERYLRSSTRGRIEDDAEGVQVDFHSFDADKVRDILVGRVEVSA